MPSSRPTRPHDAAAPDPGFLRGRRDDDGSDDRVAAAHDDSGSHPDGSAARYGGPGEPRLASEAGAAAFRPGVGGAAAPRASGLHLGSLTAPDPGPREPPPSRRPLRGRSPRLSAYLLIILVDALALVVALSLGAGLIGLLAGLAIALAAPGALLWWPHRKAPSHEVELGAALLSGAVVAMAVLVLQVQQERQADRERTRDERQQRALADRQTLQLTLSINRNLPGIDLSERDLSGFYLRRKVLDEALFTDATLDDANLSRARLRHAFLDRARLRRTVFTAADLTGANLTTARLEKSYFFLAGLRGARLWGARLEDATLTRACLVNAKLRGADLRRANMSEANLSEANLSGADLRGARLEGAVLSESASPTRPGLVYAPALADASTRWPAGFDPSRAGVHIVPSGTGVKLVPSPGAGDYRPRPGHGCAF